jgi:hypothetical protein
MSTEAQIIANRANAQLSTGPTTEAGKAKSSHNAIKTGLTGRTVLLPTDDRDIYLQHVARFFTQHQPVTDEEKSLTQSVADTEWRLLRIPSLESGIYAIGRRALANEFADESDAAVRAVMIEAQIFLNSRKDLNNLALQESRLRRTRDADLASLKSLIQARVDKRKRDFTSACLAHYQCRNAGNEFDPALFGFEFTNEELEAHGQLRQARQFAQGEYSKLSAKEYQRYMENRRAKTDAQSGVPKEAKAA